MPTDEELALRAFLREFSRRRPRWGWRRAAKAARDAGWVVNNKRVHRLWRDEGLRVPYRKRKRPLRGIGVVVGAMCPIAPNVVWALDFQFDQTADGRILKLLNVIDEFTREARSMSTDRSTPMVSSAVSTASPLSGAHRSTSVSTTGQSSSPTPWPTGAASTARTRSSSIPGRHGRTPGSSPSNGRLRDEFLNGHRFETLLEARVLLEDWRTDYNMARPHSAHDWLTPVEFAEAWLNRQQLQLA